MHLVGVSFAPGWGQLNLFLTILSVLCAEYGFYDYNSILSQTPNATRNGTESHRSKSSRRVKMTNLSTQQPINILT